MIGLARRLLNPIWRRRRSEGDPNLLPSVRKESQGKDAHEPEPCKLAANILRSTSLPFFADLPRPSFRTVAIHSHQTPYLTGREADSQARHYGLEHRRGRTVAALRSGRVVEGFGDSTRGSVQGFSGRCAGQGGVSDLRGGGSWMGTGATQVPDQGQGEFLSREWVSVDVS
jgi:hypothetical protein